MLARWLGVSAALGLLGCPDPEEQDVDGDGFIAREDCADDNEAIRPGATEVCDGLDNDCDGLIDDEDDDVDLSTERPWFADADGDGFGDPNVTTVSCAPPEAHVEDDEDCDDSDPDIHPDATEICNGGVDDDCNTFADDEDPGLDLATASTFFRDRDADDFGDADAPVQACLQPSGTVPNDTDCDDFVAEINPAAQEVCNTLDDDCDEDVDDADATLDPDTRTAFFADFDGDGYGDPDDITMACAQPAEHVLDDTDCAPGETEIHPGAPEVCNEGVDDDCNGAADDDDPGLDTTTGDEWYVDADGDGHGVDDEVMLACELPAGFSALDDDCDDTVDWIHPGAPDRCNGVDDDCDNNPEDAGVWWYDPALDAWTDFTADFESGTEAAPYAFTSTDPGELHVCAGTYYAWLTAEDDIDVIGRDGSTDTVLDGGYPSNGQIEYMFDGELFSDVTLTGLTMQNAWSGANLDRLNAVVDDVVFDDVRLNKAIRHSFGTLDLTDVTVKNSGGGYRMFEVVDATVTMTRVTFEDNVATNQAYFENSDITGADITLRGNSGTHSLFHTNCTIDYDGFTAESNTVTWGGGLYLQNTSGTVDDATFTDNEARNSGSGFLLQGGAVTVTNATISNGSAFWGGGAYLTGGSHVFDNVDIVGNLAGNDGGGVNAVSADLTMIGGSVTQNESSLQGGGVHAEGSNLTLDGVLVDGNLAEDGGGLASINPLSFTLDGVDVSNNEALDLGGGLFVSGGAHDLSDTLVTGNLAQSGAGAYLEAGSSMVCTGTLAGNDGVTGNENLNPLNEGGGVTMRSVTEILSSGDTVSSLSTFEAALCDFGTITNGDDNSPSDFLHSEVTIDCLNETPCALTTDDTVVDYEDDASFCTGADC